MSKFILYILITLLFSIIIQSLYYIETHYNIHVSILILTFILGWNADNFYNYLKNN